MTKTNVQPVPSNFQHHDTPLLFAPSGANHEQGFGLDRVCVAMKAPVGLLSGRAVLRKQDGGALPRQARWDLR